jgi:PAS domain S-box-containing protein
VILPVPAQDLKYRSDIITREKGLSNSTVTCILKDKYGFLWFGTWNGLNRYDGYDITVFQFDPSDSASISNSNINTIFEDSDGLLWIATDNGLNTFDQVTGKFKRFYHKNRSVNQRNNRFNGISEDHEGHIWVGCQEGGIVSFDKKTGQLKHFINPTSEKSNTIITLLADKLDERYLWLGTADGLFLFNMQTGSFSVKNKGIPEKPLIVVRMLQDDNGNLFMGTWGNGLFKYDRKASSIMQCSIPGQNNESVGGAIISAMAFDVNGDLIFNIRDKNMLKYLPSLNRAVELDAGEVSADLNNKSVTTLYIEPSGIIWAGTFYDGVIKIVPLINSFHYYSATLNNSENRSTGGVTAILEDSEGYLWLGTRFGGLMKINRKTHETTKYSYSPAGLSSSNILSLLEVTEGSESNIWIGTDGGGLNKFNPLTGRFKVFKSEPDKKYLGPGNNSISSILQYDKDHLLIGTRDRNLGEGLDVFNIRTGRFINMKYAPDNDNSLGSNNIMKIFKDRKGVVWIGTRNGGLNKLVVKNINGQSASDIGYFVRYINNPQDPSSLSNNTIYAIHDDKQNNLWIGTNDGGLSRFNPETGLFSSSILHEYLKDHLIYGILADNHDNLWISTSRGIIVVNLSSNIVHSFDKYDGLQETAFIYGSYFKSVSGELFFGGIRGCNSFHPDSIRLNLQVPEITITSLNFSGKKGTVNVTSLTGKSALASKTVKTPYYQNNFSITFSALDFQMPEKNRFRYMLVGYDRDWIETGAKRRYVNYTNLPPGKYIFRVIGSNGDDIWDHNGTSIAIQITPPYWRTTTFLVLLVSLVLGIISLGFFLIIRKYQMEKRQVEIDAFSSLQDERKVLRTLINNIPDIIFIKDRQSRFTLANKKVALTMGTTPENLIGKTDFDFYSSEMASMFFMDEQKIMETGIPMINVEEIARDENGNRIIRSTTKVPVKNKDGDIIGIAGVCRDITKLKQIEMQLRKKSDDLQETNRLLEGRQKEILIQSEELAEQTQNLLMMNAELDRLNRTKDKFFSIIAHDLRNPFNAIIGFSELLRNDFYEMDNPQKLNVLELINVSSQTAYNLLENLLQWARTQTDKINFNPENFDLSDAANTVIDLHCVIARKKGVRIKNNISANTLVHADKNMISTVLRNLVSNAIKFSNPDGEISLHVNQKNNAVEVVVTDDGVGMNRESLSKLFRIDTYYSTSGTMGESGTGLGLIICKEFIEKNNGRIKAISKEGSGTTMTFTLNNAKLN